MTKTNNAVVKKTAKKIANVLLIIGFILLLIITIFASVIALPAGPSINYLSNSSKITGLQNRSQDEKGTITTVTMSLNQQNYKWKAYVGNVTGQLMLDDANSKSIYDWTLSSITGEVYATRASSISWGNIACVNQATIDAEETAVGISSSAQDSINKTFNFTSHKTFSVGSVSIANSTCRSTATYINDTIQTVNETAFFQEILLRDTTATKMVYSTIIESDHAGYDGASTFDFQMIMAENESSTIPSTYFFYVELG